MGILTTKEIQFAVKSKQPKTTTKNHLPTKKTVATDGFTGELFPFCFQEEFM